MPFLRNIVVWVCGALFFFLFSGHAGYAIPPKHCCLGLWGFVFFFVFGACRLCHSSETLLFGFVGLCFFFCFRGMPELPFLRNIVVWVCGALFFFLFSGHAGTAIPPKH